MKTNFKKVKLLHLLPRWIAIFTGLMIFQLSFGQERTVSGTIIDKNGTALPGVSVIIKNTSVGVVSDINGKYIIKVPSSASILRFSFIGYQTQELPTGESSVIGITLLEEVTELNEVVVVGYGVQKKKLNTGANINVSGKNIQALNTNSTMDALKGISAGVSIIQNNGQPGAGTKVNIRGIGTNGNSQPLYIVDGVAVGNIDNLSPAEIESVDILKDAASAAIYGSRAANGVILVTTKKGKEGKTVITYDAYYGAQNVYKEPNLLNAKQFAEIMNEGKANDKKPLYDFAKLVPDWDKIQSGEWQGTAWFDEITNKDAPVQSHSLNVSGGSKKSIYSFGGSYLSQEGILGKQANSEYKRWNFRLNSEHVLYENPDHKILVFGENFSYTNTSTPSVRTGGIYWNDVHNMMVTNPFLPVHDSTGAYHFAIPWGNSSESNPIAQMEYWGKDNYNNNNTILGNAYFDIQPFKVLKFRSSYGVNNWYGTSRQWVPAYDLSKINTSPRDQVNQSMYLGYEWTLTNTMTYSVAMNSNSISIVVGNEMVKTQSNFSMSGHNENSTFQDAQHAYLDNVPILDPTYSRINGKDVYGRGLMSYFGRISYDYKETYLLTLVMRADGSSNFARGHRWGKFPSVAAGWVVSNEPFMIGTSNWLDFLKLRASWGQNGNQDIPPFQYLSTLSYDQPVPADGANYYFGKDKTIKTIGAYPPILPNPNVAWETSEQLDLGSDMNFLSNRLQLNFDLYKKDTRDWLVRAPQVATYGTGAPYINGGQITNKGFELGLRWNDRIGNFKYGISGSLTYNKNRVTAIANDEKILHGPSNVLSQGTSEIFRAQVGYPIGYFWGFKTDGIIQNSTDSANYNHDGKPYFTDTKPGDVRFVDVNNSGTINDSDKVMIGDPNPDFIFGLQINLEYKGFYLQVSTNGQSGNQIIRASLGGGDGPLANKTTDIYARWHGEGTSNKMPRLSSAPFRNVQYISDIFIEDGDFFKINNLTFGYDLKQLIKKIPVDELRLYFTAKNLYTFTNYSGMDPEVGYGPTDTNNRLNDYPWASGIDLGLYPASRSYLIGLSIKF